MNEEDKYEELVSIIETIESLLYELTESNSEYYINLLNELKFEAENELDEINNVLQEQNKKENYFKNKEFEESRL